MTNHEKSPSFEVRTDVAEREPAWCVMDFYVLKKNNKLVAIPADEGQCKALVNSGYNYVDKVAACNEHGAIAKLRAKTSVRAKLPTYLALSLLLISVIVAFLK